MKEIEIEKKERERERLKEIEREREKERAKAIINKKAETMNDNNMYSGQCGTLKIRESEKEREFRNTKSVILIHDCTFSKLHLYFISMFMNAVCGY